MMTGMRSSHLSIHSAPGRYLVWIVAFFVVLPLSRWCWRRRIGVRYARAVFFASFAIPLIVVPGLATESIRITPVSITMRGGLWFSPNIQEISLSGLEVIIDKGGGGVASDRATMWEFRYRSGSKREIILSDLFESNRGVVVEFLRKNGFKVRNP